MNDLQRKVGDREQVCIKISGGAPVEHILRIPARLRYRDVIVNKNDLSVKQWASE